MKAGQIQERTGFNESLKKSFDKLRTNGNKKT
jgi:hypothetical protein